MPERIAIPMLPRGEKGREGDRVNKMNYYLSGEK